MIMSRQSQRISSPHSSCGSSGGGGVGRLRLSVLLGVGGGADGGVGVVQVVHPAGPLRTRSVGGVAGAVVGGNDTASPREQVRQAEGLGVVGVACSGVIAEFYAQLLTFGVVGD